jgi:hypothetical protein
MLFAGSSDAERRLQSHDPVLIPGVDLSDAAIDRIAEARCGKTPECAAAQRRSADRVQDAYAERAPMRPMIRKAVAKSTFDGLVDWRFAESLIFRDVPLPPRVNTTICQTRLGKRSANTTCTSY